ncbi:MAG: alpha/beta fold hydrolase [Clostridia bacterium]|nr:alpha/beta fold hydrolase [Clostridia bacterium]
MKRFICLLMAILMLPVMGSAEPGDIHRVVTMLLDPAQTDVLYDWMSPEMQAALPKESLPTLMTQLEATCGAYQGMIDDYAEAEQQGYIVCTQTLDMAYVDLTCMLALDQNGMIAGLNFAPAFNTPDPTAPPADDASVITENVTVGEEPYALAGVLTMPASDGLVPAVVLVHGSGPSDMNETAYAVAPFRDLAEALSKAGIAVLRYDKRTYAYGAEIAAGDMTDFTVEEETIIDAIAAGRLLKNDPRIDPNRIFVLGHSLGAMLAPRIVDKSDGLFCGMILACGTNASLLDVIIQQNMDAVAALPEEQRAAVMPQIEMLKQQAAEIASMTAEEARGSQFAGQSAYYFWEMLQHPTPAELMGELALPTLIINGSRDFQVREAQGRRLWEATLNPDAPWLTCLWADVNHMLMQPDVPAEAAGTIAEYSVPCTVDATVTDAIIRFINSMGE